MPHEMEKATLGFRLPIYNMANFEAVRWVISSSINLFFLKSALSPLEKKYVQRLEKLTCKPMPIVVGFVYFLLSDLIEVLRHKSQLEMTNFGDPNNAGNGNTANFFSIGGTKTQ